ncbi:sensor histidine kinase [Streptomyces sp. NPDC004539]|uniref:sensor histidine kinase n=1 Tax=Streptomyces sp. NPDC004539 TaxID=3154280 RepID=UPI0033A0F4E1
MSTQWQRYAGEHARTVDTMSAVLLFAAFLFGSEITMPRAEQPDETLPTLAYGAVACVALLLWQRSRPRTTTALTAACVAGGSALGHLLTPLLLAPLMLALYRLATLTRRRTVRRYYAGSLALVVLSAVLLDPVPHPWAMKVVSPAAWLLLPAVLGNAVRLSRAYLTAVQQRAEFAERGREEEARHRVTEERVRIARELHDVVAHHLALANAQAGTAAHLARTHPQQVAGILTDLSGTTSSALRELKATVGLLRQAGESEAPLAPAPGLDRLAELTRACATAGLDVEVSTEGAPRPLSPGVDLTAYRIVQEALTNVAKHAGTRAARVRLRYGRDHVTLTVTDDGTGPAAGPAAQGFGLIGMRERALSMGGALHAGHRPEGGFEVTTRLPLYPAPTPPQERTP